MNRFGNRISFFFLLIILSTNFFSNLFAEKNKRKYYDGGEEEQLIIYSKENIDSDKKIPLQAVLIKRPDAKGTVLICHGFSADKYTISFIHTIFKDFNTLAFDFRGHGQCDKYQSSCTLGRNEVFDVIAAAKYIKSRPDLKDKPLFVYGFSMGAVASIIAQSQDDNLFDAMVLDCPFDSTDNLLNRGLEKIKLNMFGYELPIPGKSFLRSYAYNTYLQNFVKTMLKVFSDLNSQDIPLEVEPVYPNEAIKYITVPCFIICCYNDEKVPVDAVRDIYEGAGGYKRLWLTHGRHHFDSIFFKLPEYFYRVRRFLDVCLDESIKNKVQSKIIKDTGLSPEFKAQPKTSDCSKSKEKLF